MLLHESYEWFEGYARSYDCDDPDVRAHMRMKEEHTRIVAADCARLARFLGLDAADRRLAEMIGLFHDVGRFKQYTLYRTFNDRISVNHALLGLEEIAAPPFLRALPAADRRVLRFAVANHNAIAIDAAGGEREQLFARIIRDADKLDIYRVLEPTLLAPAGDGCSPRYLDNLAAGRQCDYTDMKTADDRKLVRLSWIYDIHYSWTMRRIAARGYVERIFAALGDQPAIRRARAAVLAHMRRKIEN